MEYISCPWCSCRFEGYPPLAAAVRSDGLHARRSCPGCRGGIDVVWSRERDKILQVRHAPQPKLRWEPSFNGPTGGWNPALDDSRKP